MDKRKLDKRDDGTFDIDTDAFYNNFHVGSATECTGLMSSEPLSVDEAKSLAELYSIHTPFPADYEASEEK